MPNSVRAILKKALYKGAISQDEYDKVMRNVVDVRCGECIYQQGDKRIPRDLNCYIDGRDAPDHGFCWMGKRKEVEDE